MTGDFARILVIRLGALGDFVLSLGPCAAIRRHHKGAHITLLTTEPFVEFARMSGYFDEIWVDSRPRLFDLGGWLALRRRLRAGRFGRVYDLQTSDRTAIYFRLMGPGPRPEWSGVARGASHPDRNPDRRRVHTADRQRAQLRQAGIDDVPPPDLSWARSDIRRFGLPPSFALLVPGGAAHRPEKRWPAWRYGELAERLADRGVAPVLIGGAAEAEAADEIARRCLAVRSLVGETSLADLAVLAREAVGAVGNDTGPMHLIAAAGCPSVVLFSRASDPARTAPRAPAGRPPVTVVKRDDLAALSTDEVALAFSAALNQAGQRRSVVR
ncbi:MAG TPA: glycosyltransferase family 9 protein [Alphaproteobacteria bacterium]